MYACDEISACLGHKHAEIEALLALVVSDGPRAAVVDREKTWPSSAALVVIDGVEHELGLLLWMLLVGVGVGIHGHAADRHRRTAVVAAAAGDVERNLLCRRRRTRGWVARSIGFDFESILVKKKEVQCARARGNYVLVHVRGRGTRTGAGLLFCYSSLMQVGLYQRRPWNNVT